MNENEKALLIICNKELYRGDILLNIKGIYEYNDTIFSMKKWNK